MIWLLGLICGNLRNLRKKGLHEFYVNLRTMKGFYGK